MLTRCVQSHVLLAEPRGGRLHDRVRPTEIAWGGRNHPMKQLTKPHAVGLLGQSDGSSKTADFLTVADWALRLQVSKRTIFRMIDEETIPPYDLSLGKVRRWHFSTYERWVASQVRGN